LALIAAHYRLNLKVVNDVVNPTFRFMTLDWDSRIRMDPSSSYAMRPLVALKDQFDICVACDTDRWSAAV
jgi:phosphoglucomutase